MTFVLRMAMREIRASWKRLLFFFVCIAIGVASIVAIRSVIQSVRGALRREARFLLAADMRVQSNSPLTPAVRQRARSRAARRPHHRAVRGDRDRDDAAARRPAGAEDGGAVRRPAAVSAAGHA